MDGMPRPRPPGLHKEVTRHGKTIWYVRHDRGKRIRIRGDFGSPEFSAALDAAMDGVTIPTRGKAAHGSLEWLWMLYRQSRAWVALSAATRRQRENIMRSVVEAVGPQALSRFNRKAILAACERRKAYQARHMIDTMRGMYQWAIYNELVTSDPTQGIKIRKPKTSGFPVWSEDEIADFEARWPRGTRERVAFDVFLYTGLRRGDVARLGRQHIRNGVIAIDTEKTGTRVTIPVLPELQASLDAGPLGELAIVATVDGKPMSKESLGNFFRDACRAAGVRKSAHGLRKAAATHAANHGATEAQLEAIFGWTGGKMASLYTRSADREALATDAASKLSRLGSRPK